MLTKRRIVGAKIEVAPGTAETLTAADAAMNVFDPEFSMGVDFEERQGQGTPSPLPGVPAGRKATLKFITELHGSGDVGDPVPAWADTLLPACGFVKTVHTFAPSSLAPQAAGAATKTLTLALWEDGRLKKICGAMGTFKITCPSGKRILIEWTFTGALVEPVADEALPAPTYPSVSPLVFRASTLTVGAWHPDVAELSIDAGNDVQLREDAEKASGYDTAVIVGRRVTGTLDPEAGLVAGNDQHAAWLARTEQALAIVIPAGSGNGNQVTIAAPKLQWTDVQAADRSGVLADTLTFQANRSTSAGDDELSITFS